MRSEMRYSASIWVGLLCGLCCLVLAGSPVMAQTPAPVDGTTATTDQKVKLAIPKRAAPAKDKKGKAKKPKNGWFPKLSLGINTLLNHSANVPGVDDGFTFSLGIVINGELFFRHNAHEWKTTLKGVHTQTKTPNIEPLVKTADNVDLQSFYTYRFKGPGKIGLFGGLQLNLALLPGVLVVAGDTELAPVDPTVTLPDGTTARPNTPYPLTPAFAPLIFKQKIGVEAKPYEDKYAAFELKLSAAAQEVFASGFVVQDDAATPTLELAALRDYQQFGAELEVKVSGDINKRISYLFQANLMYPIVTSVDTDLEGFDLLNADLSMKVSFKLAKWASIDYVFGARLVPLLFRKWQVTNNLVLSIKADIF